MSLESNAKRVRIYVNEGDHVGHQAVDVAILSFLRRENAAGATVFRAVEGFAGDGDIHTSRLVDSLRALPLVIEWVDSAERVEQLLGPIKQMVKRGLITVDPTEVVLYAPLSVRRVSAHVSAADVMSREVATVAPEVPVRDVVELLLGKEYRAVPVVEGGVPVGIITNSDLVNRGGLGVRIELLPSLDTPELHAELERLSRNQKTAREVMTARPVTVPDNAALPHVADLMVRHRLKRLPVVDAQGHLVGVVSRLDLLRTVAQGGTGDESAPRELGLNASMEIARIVRRDVPTVHPETPVAEVMQAVFSTRLNRAVVVDQERRVLGLITDAELLERVTPSLRPSALRSLMHRLPFAPRRVGQHEAEQHGMARTAAELMVADVPTAEEHTLLGHALAPMLQGKEKLIAVVDAERRLVGVVDRADILRGLAVPS
jgi:CBS domain-containing protein/PII-like signaling protein